MNQSSVQPAWETISGASPTSKSYWAQWDALRLKDGLLQRQWVTTDGLNKYIFGAMDYFTKWPEAYVIPNLEATIARVLVDQFFCRFGVPQELHSDQGKNSESAVFRRELAKYCVEGHTEWDQKLPTLLIAYRVSCIDTGKTDVGSQTAASSGPADKEGESFTEVAESIGRTIHGTGAPFKYDLPEQEGRKAQPKVVHVNRLWQYHGPGQYTWEDSEELSPTTEELRAVPIRRTRP
ncbi:uncharacterized protein LOC121869870 [Homarus americanus]|uniref:uncharacterized protein LOC121869870 n=1 Tax=Homarus americanus TaxID=6706 RepID=UPI001C459187|nr:uncharacterized protein LOC121869870 [Homarus americanus]